mmetsp:Transcript_48906/g.97574  ORF Transcript_48906/g.97574 Transcript_48906/m.97574 type:complete len:217 (-) Transcript_48906:1729-2379(-)
MSEGEYARLMRMASRPVGDDSPAASMRSAAKRPRTEVHDSDEDCGITPANDITPKEAAPAGLSTPAEASPTGAVPSAGPPSASVTQSTPPPGLFISDAGPALQIDGDDVIAEHQHFFDKIRNARRPNMLKTALVLEVITAAEAANVDPASCLHPAAILSRVVKKDAPLPPNAIQDLASIFSMAIAPAGDDSPAGTGGAVASDDSSPAAPSDLAAAK